MEHESADTSDRLQRALKDVARLEKQLQGVEAAQSQGDAKQLQAEVAKLRVENMEPRNSRNLGPNTYSYNIILHDILILILINIIILILMYDTI